MPCVTSGIANTYTNTEEKVLIMNKMLFVFNPNSGKAQIKNVLMRIIQIFSEAEYEVVVYPTKAPLDGYNHIIESEGKYDVIVCSGGDGG